MSKTKVMFVCQECGSQRTRWEGKCHDCGAWNSLVEEKTPQASSKSSARGWTIGQGGGGSKVLRSYKLNENFDETLCEV